MKNDGTSSEELFEAYVRRVHPLAFLYRIADQKELSRGNALKGIVTRRTPSDYILTDGGVMAYTEVKSCSNDISFPFSYFTPGQNHAMTRQVAAGGSYWIWIHNISTNMMYRITGQDVLGARHKGKKSLKWTEIIKLAKESFDGSIY